MTQIMVDLETMGTAKNSAIVSIGACQFDLDTIDGVDDFDESRLFYRNVDLNSCVEAGLIIDADTVLWWMKQSDAARKSLTENAVPLEEALAEFAAFVSVHDTQGLWGNGATFDNVIIREAFKAAGLGFPLHFTTDRCYRTMKALNKKVKAVRVGTHHNALDDAISQAVHLQRIMSLEG